MYNVPGIACMCTPLTLQTYVFEDTVDRTRPHLSCPVDYSSMLRLINKNAHGRPQVPRRHASTCAQLDVGDERVERGTGSPAGLCGRPTALFSAFRNVVYGSWPSTALHSVSKHISWRDIDGIVPPNEKKRRRKGGALEGTDRAGPDRTGRAQHSR